MNSKGVHVAIAAVGVLRQFQMIIFVSSQATSHQKQAMIRPLAETTFYLQDVKIIVFLGEVLQDRHGRASTLP